MTSGGTESIVLTVKSSRDYMKYKNGITRPEMYLLRRHVNRNTIMIVGSAPGFPHGIIYPVEVDFVSDYCNF
ncbi:hypothetical protein IGI04_036796 [Brassica rapa subsp. trilocularis]|uniref:Uncharacterized protein n=2 Tax=Brassica campestris TaxID=3711 RepID=A0A3P5Y2P2_BRACM|nr:hypothetical protein IGI04_036796 [Brassica rapa subsp. trilocularis]CAG7864510.1 unnamed protein product [Brassica rapa]VDC61722.1 unnamed protein product [Brassica rapa]